MRSDARKRLDESIDRLEAATQRHPAGKRPVGGGAGYVCPTACQYAEDVGMPGAASPPCPGGYCEHYAPTAARRPADEDGLRAALADLVAIKDAPEPRRRKDIEEAWEVARAILARHPADQTGAGDA